MGEGRVGLAAADLLYATAATERTAVGTVAAGRGHRRYRPSPSFRRPPPHPLRRRHPWSLARIASPLPQDGAAGVVSTAIISSMIFPRVFPGYEVFLNIFCFLRKWMDIQNFVQIASNRRCKWR